MPELPEVESTVRRLNSLLSGTAFTGADVLWKRTIDNPSYRKFSGMLSGGVVNQVYRVGKLIGVEFQKRDDDALAARLHLFIHLRMSGRLNVLRANVERHKHDRVIIFLNNGRELRFRDTRKFGRMTLVSEAQEVTNRLGPDAFTGGVGTRWFAQNLSNRCALIKPLLLNQQFLAGLGNIYVDEILWRSGIHPQRRAGELTGEELQQLPRQMRLVLRRAIDMNGTDFGDDVIERGGYSPSVYGRVGEPCKRCKHHIERIVVGQRGTYFCPVCQTV